MARGAIWLEINRQLRRHSRKKGKSLASGQEGPTALADGAIRALTAEVAEDLKGKAEAKYEAELEAKIRRRKEKALHDAMIYTWWSV